MVKLKVENIFPLTDLQRNPGKVIAKAKSTRDPVIITQHGRPAVVIVDVSLFEELESRAISMNTLADPKVDRKNNLEAELKRISSEIVSRYKPEKIILFGSLASGDVKETSDMDLVVIKETNKRFWDRQKELASLVRPKLACDIFVYTPKEWKESLSGKSKFAADEIKGRGRVIYEKAT